MEVVVLRPRGHLHRGILDLAILQPASHQAAGGTVSGGVLYRHRHLGFSAETEAEGLGQVLTTDGHGLQTHIRTPIK